MEEIAVRSWVARERTNLSLLESAVLGSCDGSEPVIVKTNSELKRERSASVAREKFYVKPEKHSFLCEPSFAEKNMHLPESIDTAQGSHMRAWLGTISKEWALDVCFDTVRLYKSHLKNMDKSTNIYSLLRNAINALKITAKKKFLAVIDTSNISSGSRQERRMLHDVRRVSPVGGCCTELA